MRARDRMWPLFNRLIKLHVAVYRATGGRIGHRAPGAPPTVLLDHVGARTGQKRTTALAYFLDGEDVVVVASKGGHPKHPAWYHNLVANPDTTIQVGSERRAVRAHVATPEEHARLWPKAVEANRLWGEYQKRATRQIPMIILRRNA
jgi:F420H(2)-dependent quinone reductase